MTVKVHEPKVTPPSASAAEPNLANVNNVVVVPDERMKVNATGLLPFPVVIYVILQRFYIRGLIGWTIKG